MRITHSYHIKEIEGAKLGVSNRLRMCDRVHLHLLDENGHTYALLDLSRNEWSQLYRCKAPSRPAMTLAADRAVLLNV